MKAGDVIVYTIVTSNTGGTAGTTVLSDPVPGNTTYSGTGEGWSCAKGSAAGTACTQSLTVAATATTSVTYTVTVVDPLPQDTTQVANLVASSTGTCSDCHPVNPTVPVLDTVKIGGHGERQGRHHGDPGQGGRRHRLRPGDHQYRRFSGDHDAVGLRAGQHHLHRQRPGLVVRGRFDRGHRLHAGSDGARWVRR